MNALQEHIAANNLNEVEVLNQLQSEATVISDLCLTAADVWRDDTETAVRWLKMQKGELI